MRRGLNEWASPSEFVGDYMPQLAAPVQWHALERRERDAD